MDFNQYTEWEVLLRVLLEVQSAITHIYNYVTCQGALNSKAVFSHKLFSRYATHPA
jgi:hypothetical protein